MLYHWRLLGQSLRWPYVPSHRLPVIQRPAHCVKFLIFRWRGWCCVWLGIVSRSLCVESCSGRVLLPPTPEVEWFSHGVQLYLRILFAEDLLFFVRFRWCNGSIIRPLRFYITFLSPMRRKREPLRDFLLILTPIREAQLLQFLGLDFLEAHSTLTIKIAPHVEVRVCLLWRRV